jgi:hypothetical protein
MDLIYVYWVWPIGDDYTFFIEYEWLITDGIDDALVVPSRKKSSKKNPTLS